MMEIGDQSGGGGGEERILQLMVSKVGWGSLC